MLKVYTTTLDLRTLGPKQQYDTPIRAGKVYVQGVTWPHMTVAVYDSNPLITFVFDLATRQWVNP